ncbi:MAG: class I SAM-dependent methyltransferase [Candidatus Ranarchaeia archaeon]|jgi:SAM-dependent methyltransferase
MSKDITPYQGSAQYYDLLYQKKDYAKETADFLLLAKDVLGRSLTTLLDLGCGTGNHAVHLAHQGVGVVGIDQSKTQIEIAQQKAEKNHLTAAFMVDDMVNPQLDEVYDAASVFFGGFGYLLTDALVLGFLQNISKLVNPEGFLYLEFWHTLGVKPESNHYLVAEDETTKIVRVNTTHFDTSTGIVTMPMQHFVFRYNQFHEEFTETHQVRTYSVPQFKSLIGRSPWEIKHLFVNSFRPGTKITPPTKDDFRINAVLTH